MEEGGKENDHNHRHANDPRFPCANFLTDGLQGVRGDFCEKFHEIQNVSPNRLQCQVDPGKIVFQGSNPGEIIQKEKIKIFVQVLRIMRIFPIKWEDDSRMVYYNGSQKDCCAV